MGRAFGSLVSGAVLIGLAGCSGASGLPIVSDVALPKIPVPRALRIETTADKPRTLIERALSACDQRIEAGETACLKKAIGDAHLSVPALVALVPGCRLGRMCHAAYTTEDVIGLLSSTASHYVVRWRADFDLTRRPTTTEAVPITVVQAS